MEYKVWFRRKYRCAKVRRLSRQPALLEAAFEFTEAEAGIDENAFASAMDNGGGAGTAASEYRHADMC